MKLFPVYIYELFDSNKSIELLAHICTKSAVASWKNPVMTITCVNYRTRYEVAFSLPHVPLNWLTSFPAVCNSGFYIKIEIRNTTPVFQTNWDIQRNYRKPNRTAVLTGSINHWSPWLEAAQIYFALLLIWCRLSNNGRSEICVQLISSDLRASFVIQMPVRQTSKRFR